MAKSPKGGKKAAGKSSAVSSKKANITGEKKKWSKTRKESSSSYIYKVLKQGRSIISYRVVIRKISFQGEQEVQTNLTNKTRFTFFLSGLIIQASSVKMRAVCSTSLECQ